MNKLLRDRLTRTESFTSLDLHFADFMQKLDGRKDDDASLFLAAACVSSMNRHGHVCLELSQFAGRKIFEGADFFYPDLGTWRDVLQTSPAVGRPGEFKPLIFDGNSKLYLHRYSVYQTRLASFIKSRLAASDPVMVSGLKQHLNLLFNGNPSDGEIDWQKIACLLSVINGFTVISGGPGTGKTTTIVKIISLFLAMNPEKNPKIALAVPTGKAAARLQDAIRDARDSLPCAEEIKSKIPSAASTIHRLLGSISGSPHFRHHENNRLDVDMVIIDESSMVDLALLSKLTMALPDHARLILVGDKDQLASVEAGSAFGDICDTCRINSFSEPVSRMIFDATGMEMKNNFESNPESNIRDCMVQLVKSYRFGETSGIRKISQAINAGNDTLAMEYLEERKYPDIRWEKVPGLRHLQAGLKHSVIKEFHDYLSAESPSDALMIFGKFQVLCALREGPYGVHVINRLIEEILVSSGRIRKADSLWYHGRPVMITRNDYHLNLFNGDVGIAWQDPKDFELRVFFPDEANGFRTIHPSRIGEHETVYAMTVHKSQGSEFDNILLLLPDRESPVLTRELVYTAITRARKQVMIWGDASVLHAAVQKRVERISGLPDALLTGLSQR
ncbi:MAG: exodeoxyribonuclease V subunit alpha [Pseudomonadota bacterium]